MLKSIFVLLIHSLNHLQLLLHLLKLSFSTHYLQIYCIGLAKFEFTYPLGTVFKPSPYNIYTWLLNYTLFVCYELYRLVAQLMAYTVFHENV